jgi:hypothetical protein
MNNCEVNVPINWNAPFAPGPIDAMRRRQVPLTIKRLQCTLPVKRKLTCNTQLFFVHPNNESFQLILHK